MGFLLVFGSSQTLSPPQKSGEVWYVCHDPTAEVLVWIVLGDSSLASTSPTLCVVSCPAAVQLVLDLLLCVVYSGTEIVSWQSDHSMYLQTVSLNPATQSWLPSLPTHLNRDDRVRLECDESHSVCKNSQTQLLQIEGCYQKRLIVEFRIVRTVVSTAEWWYLQLLRP